MIVGIDGYRDGWVAAAVDGRAVSWAVASHIREILDRWPGVPTGVDMPVGLPGRGPRAADLRAREFLRERGGPMASVFLAPTRAVLDDHRRGLSHAAAMAAARARGEPATSMQMWQLLTKVADVDTVRDRVLEVHPECSFRELDGRVDATKKCARGVGQRLRALSEPYDVVLADVPPGPGVDDALDAVAVAWSVGRWVRGGAIRLGDDAAAIWV